MPLNYKKRQQKLTFDALMQTLSQEFERLPDHRRNNTSYPLETIPVTWARARQEGKAIEQAMGKRG